MPLHPLSSAAHARVPLPLFEKSILILIKYTKYWHAIKNKNFSLHVVNYVNTFTHFSSLKFNFLPQLEKRAHRIGAKFQTYLLNYLYENVF